MDDDKSGILPVRELEAGDIQEFAGESSGKEVAYCAYSQVG